MTKKVVGRNICDFFYFQKFDKKIFLFIIYNIFYIYDTIAMWVDKIERILGKVTESLGFGGGYIRTKINSILTEEDKYKRIKLMMDKKNIDEFSLEWAEMMIENWLWNYVVCNIKKFNCNHNDIVDMLIIHHEGHLLSWKDSNTVKDFNVDPDETLDKLVFTGQGNYFLWKKKFLKPIRETGTPIILMALNKFKDNPKLRKLVMDDLSKKNDSQLSYEFSRRRYVNKLISLLSDEEIQKYKGIIDRLKNIVNEH